MNKLTEFQEKWLTALESGKYSQTKSRLRHCGGYCCLGVACELAREVYNDEYIEEMLRAKRVLDKTIASFLGLYSEYGDVKSGGFGIPYVPANMNGELQEFRTLVDANDNGMTFKEIAAWIRANPEEIFQTACRDLTVTV